jgi:hypothetical protein
MQVIQGTSKGTVRIRQSPAGEDFTPPRFLQKGDTIEADRNEAQWLHLTKINGVSVTEEQWASAGARQQYVEWTWVTVPDEPPPASSHVVELYIDGVLEFRKVLTPATPSVQLYQYGEDEQVLGEVRGCAAGGCPAVMVLNDNPDTIFDPQWQFFLYAINPGMSLNAIIALMGDAKALMNNTGIGDPDSPRANYIEGTNLDNPAPRLDKLRTFARNIHTGVEMGQDLLVKTFDGNNPPPLKPGKTYPNTVAEVNLDDYLITPQTNLEMFLVCNNIRSKPGNETSIFPFDNGGRYPWTPEPTEMYSFFPLVSQFQIISPLANWNKIPLGSPLPSHYRRVP